MGGICIIYPADPVGVMPSGIDTFIEGLIRWAPLDVDISLIGITTDPETRRVGEWNRCTLGGRAFDFYPVVAHTATGRRPFIPVSVRFTVSLLLRKPSIEADLLEFHRLEPLVAFLRDPRPKTGVVHQDMAALRNKQADIRWKYLPGLYFALERFLVRRLSAVFCVRESAVEAYRRTYPEYRDRFSFTPTWADPTLFAPATALERQTLRTELTRAIGYDAGDEILISVGRLDHQKDPMLLIRAFALVKRRRPTARLVLIGDGVLRADVERSIESAQLADSVTLLGLKPKSEIVRWLKAADAFVLSSAYEGMPMAALEALSTGLPVAATDVGEVRRVVKPGVNGEITERRTPQDLGDAIVRCLDAAARYRGGPCVAAVADFSPAKVVARIYAAYRALLQDAGGEARQGSPHVP